MLKIILRGGLPALLLLTACTIDYAYSPSQDRFGPSAPKDRILDPFQYAAALQQKEISYPHEVKPLLDSRCVVCHACYDAPCQLKLGSFEGIDRGATKETVYNARRLEAQEPTRLFTDAKDTSGWREKGFFPILNEAEHSSLANLNNSLLYRMLDLKRSNPLPTGGKLPATFELDINRSLECPTIDEFARYRKKHPQWGMPYAMPGLDDDERDILVRWLLGGAKVPVRPPLPSATQEKIAVWEAFLNGRSLKERLMARYVYEHLFLGHLHFQGHGADDFFSLVRSRTPPGIPIDEIATVRPYDDPGTTEFHYRLRPVVSTIVDKNHFVYELSDARIRRYRQLFLTPDYRVPELPSYDPESASNPFKTFAAIPSKSRYRFLLDDAAFFVDGFVKGPVCRGQIALNVIRDRFWVAFFNPDLEYFSKGAEFLSTNSRYLTLPASEGDAPGLTGWIGYDALQQRYLERKEDFITRSLPAGRGPDLNFVWDGDGRNRNALLTVFRHFDSASVLQGLVGDTPLTGWLVSFPVFERIHYLLVAGFNVYGAVGHQLATRLYMDFLRMEAENDFLRFMPAARRRALHAEWNKGVGARIKQFFETPLHGLERKTEISFAGDDPREEFFAKLRDRLGEAAGPDDVLNRCAELHCLRPDASPAGLQADESMRAIARLKGRALRALPEIAFVRVITDDQGDEDPTYTLLRNEALSNVSFMFAESLRREPENDTVTVMSGLHGGYPNFFFTVPSERLPEFAALLAHGDSQAVQETLYREFGIRRNNPRFWQHADWFMEKHRAENPVGRGLLDLSRYDNL